MAGLYFAIQEIQKNSVNAEGEGMTRQKTIVIQIICASIMFGMWQDSWLAGAFMWGVLFCLDMIIRG
jgi:uncharacterized membrane protein YbaN (DUF454 family)